MPATLRELVRERLAALPDPVLQILQVVSALAEPTLSLLEAMEPESGHGPNVIDAAIDAGLLELDDERVRFTHPLLASGAYGGMGRRRAGPFIGGWRRW